MRIHKSTGPALVLLLGLTACGDGGGGAAGAAAPRTTDAAVTAGLDKTVAGYLEPPTSIGITEPLSRRPDTGKYVISVQSGEPTSLKTDEGLTEAAEALGWRLEIVREGTSPEDPARAFGQALDKKPDAILISGNPLSTLRAQVDRAKRENITVLNSDTGEPVGKDGSIYTSSLDDFNQTGLWGKMVADHAAVQGSKHALLVDLSLYPILHAFVEGAQAELAEVSPDTRTTVLDVQIQDFVNGKVPAAVVSEIQRNPDIDFIILALGDMATGLEAALRGAGFADKVKIGGQSAGTPNITALKAGDQHVYTGFAALIHGWRRADALARIFNGDPLEPNHESTLPTQLLTPDNIQSAPIGDDGYYIGVEDFREQYKTLWKLS